MPPLDINPPVTNPALTAALDALLAADTAASRQQVAEQLEQATYLVAILDDELRTTPGTAPGQVTLQAGSRFGVLTCDDGEGGQVLPVFTDWETVRSWTDQPVSALVMPAGEAWSFAQAGSYAGVIVNPANQGIFLSADVVARLAPAPGSANTASPA